MIGEEELVAAITEDSALAGIGERLQFDRAGIDAGPVSSYARRYAQVKVEGGAPYAQAAAGGFMLGFRLGVLAARHERMDA